MFRAWGMDNRRKTIVVNRPFQYQYSLLVVALAVLGTNLFLIVQMLVPGDQPFSLSSDAALVLGLIEILLIVYSMPSQINVEGTSSLLS